MRQPVEPNKEDCCNSGCNPCIFDVYDKQMKLYKKYLECGETSTENLERGDTRTENGISQLEYTKFMVIKNTKLCDSHSLICFRKNTSDNKRVWWKPGDHFLCKYISMESSCSRAYTPIRSDGAEESIDFSVIIKKYEQGLVSTFLYNLKQGDETWWRGPYGHYEIAPNRYSRIIMLAQGTGIAPFISIIQHILNNEDDMTKIILLYCCKNADTILFRDNLYALKSYWNFKYDVFLSDVPKITEYKYQEPLHNFRLQNDYLNQFRPFLSSDQFILCGSSQFMESFNNWLMNEPSLTENIILF